MPIVVIMKLDMFAFNLGSSKIHPNNSLGGALKLLTTLLIFVTTTIYASQRPHGNLGRFEPQHHILNDYHETGWLPHTTPYCERQYLFESWNGWRKLLTEKGITVTSNYVADALGNPVGGETRGFAYTGSLALNTNIDFEKMCGICGSSAYVAFGWRAGKNLRNKIGNQFPPAQVFGNQTVWLNQIYLQQTFYNGNILIKAGRIEAGDNFLQNPLFYNFVSNAFDGNPIGIFFNVVFSAYPNPQWGTYFQVNVSPTVIAKFAIYNANPDVSDESYHGCNFKVRRSDGAQFITEWTYLHNHGKFDCGLPGMYKTGLFYYSGKFNKFSNSETCGNHGYYFMLDQMVYREGGSESDQGLTPFATLLFAPKDRNTFPFFFSSGLVYKGLFPERCKDISSLGVAYGSYSSDLREVQRITQQTGIPLGFGDRPQNFEMVIDINHRYYLNKWSYIQPDLQYIINPKGFGDIDNALVIGAQFEIIF